ncbi:MAG: hypothetical protein SF051_01860 [Elusimicrobiota bacterium]|nr:hypothetical protein [Elusimicrobiota bacterium]
MSSVLVLVLAAAVAAADPLAAPLAEQAAAGWVVRDRVVRGGKPFPLAAVVLGREDAPGNRLEVYALLKDRAYMIWTHPGSGERLDLDAGPVGRSMPDLLGDGSRVIAYRSTVPALNATTLRLLAARGLKIEPAGTFPEGRFLTADGKTLVAARDLPLGRFLSVGCEEFGTTSQSAFKTTLHAPRKGRFVEVSASYPDFYAAEIARKEAALARMKDDLEKHAGEYLGLALSLYFDYAARGEARRGWERQAEFFRVPAYAPPSVKACFSTMRADLRSRLRIPADWP